MIHSRYKAKEDTIPKHQTKQDDYIFLKCRVDKLLAPYLNEVRESYAKRQPDRRRHNSYMEHIRRKKQELEKRNKSSIDDSIFRAMLASSPNQRMKLTLTTIDSQRDRIANDFERSRKATHNLRIGLNSSRTYRPPNIDRDLIVDIKSCQIAKGIQLGPTMTTKRYVPTADSPRRYHDTVHISRRQQSRSVNDCRPWSPRRYLEEKITSEER